MPLTDAEGARLVRGCSTPGATEAGVVPDADARRALLLILAVLERHGRALRTLLARVGGPDLAGVLAALERRERSLREATRQLRAQAARATAGRHRRGADGTARQGVLPLTAPLRATEADAAAGVIPGVVGDRSERLWTNDAFGERRGRDEQGRMRQRRGRSPPW